MHTLHKSKAVYQQALNHQVKVVSYTTKTKLGGKTWPTSCL